MRFFLLIAGLALMGAGCSTIAGGDAPRAVVAPKAKVRVVEKVVIRTIEKPCTTCSPCPSASPCPIPPDQVTWKEVVECRDLRQQAPCIAAAPKCEWLKSFKGSDGVYVQSGCLPSKLINSIRADTP